MSRKRERRRGAATPVVHDQGVPDPLHVDEVMVSRESDASDRLLFFEMLHKTSHVHSEANPDLACLPQIGLAPFDDPVTHRATVIGDAKARTALFMTGETLVMYHMGSAALSDLNDSNVFTDRLIDVIKRHSPLRLRVFAIHRLVRDRDNAARLEVVLRKYRVKIITKEVELDLTKQTDQLMWSMLSGFAAAERDAIVERNTLGRVAQARRGEWPHGRQHVPFGYVLEGKTLRPEPAMKATIEKMLVWMSDPSLTSADLVQRLGSLGLSRARTRDIHGDSGTLAEVRHPKDVRRSLESWLPLYESGVYRMELPCPTPGYEHFGGLPVFHDSSDDPRGFVELCYEFGLPDGGWASPVVFERIRTRSSLSAGVVATANSSKKRRRPFSGRPYYRIGDETFRLDSGTANGYRLQRLTTRQYAIDNATGRAISESRRHVVESATTVATVDAQALHRAVADGLVAALSAPQGVEGRLADQVYLQRPTAAKQAVDLLRSRIARIEARAAGARAAAAQSSDHRVAAKFVTDAEFDEAELEQTRLHLDELLNEETDSVALEPVTADDAVLRALLAIGRASDTVGNDVAAAITRVIPRFELHPGSSPTTITWLATVCVPLDDGYVLELGPIVGKVATRSVSGPTGTHVTSTRTARIVERFSRGEDAHAAAVAEERSLLTAKEAIFKALMAGGFPKNSAYHLRGALVPELRAVAGIAAAHRLPDRIVAEQLTATQIEAELEALGAVPTVVDTAWAAHVLGTYSQGVDHNINQVWIRRRKDFETALTTVAAGRRTVADVAAALGHRLEPSDLVQRLTTENAPLQRSSKWVVDPTTKRVLTDSEFEPYHCPHCGAPIFTYVLVPENPRGLLCSNCRRSPAPDSPIFPQSYFCFDEVVANIVPAPYARCRAGDVLTAEQEQAILVDYRAGLPTLDIVERHGIGTSRLYPLLDRHGVQRRNPKSTRSSKKYAAAEHDHGH